MVIFLRICLHRSTRRCKLVVCAIEIGGRWSEEAWNFLTLLAKAKARWSTPALQKSTEFCLLRRWSIMLAVAAQTAFAGSLLGESSGQTAAHADVYPALGDVLQARELGAEGPSRLL